MKTKNYPLKSFLLLVFVIFLSIPIRSQNAQVFFHPEIQKITMENSRPGCLYIKNNVQLFPQHIFGKYGEELGLSDDDEMRLVNKNPLSIPGMEVYRYDRFYKGIKVADSRQIIITKYGYAIKMSGQELLPIALNIQATVSLNNVKKVVRNKYEHGLENNTISFHDHVNNLIILQNEEINAHRLAFQLEVYGMLEGPAQVYVDAHNNEIIKNRNMAHYCVPDDEPTCYNGVQSLSVKDGVTNANGQEVFILQDDCDHDIHTKTSNPVNPPTAEGFFIGWNNGQMLDLEDESGDWSWATNSAAAHWAVTAAWDYYEDVHDWPGPDGAGMLTRVGTELMTVANQNGSPYFIEAFATLSNSGTIFNIGIGRLNQTSCLATTDVMGHEYTHGVIATAGAVTTGSLAETLALTESYCDIMGNAVQDYTLNGTGNYNVMQIGEETGTVIRNLCVQDTNLMSQFNPNGDEHENGGIQNKWFCSLCNVYDLSLEDALCIAYNTMMAIGPNTTFQENAETSALMAAEKFGYCSTEHEAVINAWADREIYLDAPDDVPPILNGIAGPPSLCVEETGLYTLNFGDLGTNNFQLHWFVEGGDLSILSSDNEAAQVRRDQSTPGNDQLCAYALTECGNFSKGTVCISIGTAFSQPPNALKGPIELCVGQVGPYLAIGPAGATYTWTVSPAEGVELASAGNGAELIAYEAGSYSLCVTAQTGDCPPSAPLCINITIYIDDDCIPEMNAGTDLEFYHAGSSIQSEQSSLKEVDVYPNPFGAHLNLVSSTSLKKENISFHIYDLMGKSVFDKKIVDGNERINLNNLPAGLYIMLIKNRKGDIISKKKLVKQL